MNTYCLKEYDLQWSIWKSCKTIKPLKKSFSNHIFILVLKFKKFLITLQRFVLSVCKIIDDMKSVIFVLFSSDSLRPCLSLICRRIIGLTNKKQVLLETSNAFHLWKRTWMHVKCKKILLFLYEWNKNDYFNHELKIYEKFYKLFSALPCAFSVIS